MVQGDTEQDKQIRQLCSEAEQQTKRLAKELNKYVKEAWHGWWAVNQEFKQDLKNRLRDGYRIEK